MEVGRVLHRSLADRSGMSRAVTCYNATIRVQSFMHEARVVVQTGTLHVGDIIHTINGWKARGSHIDTVAGHMVCVYVCVHTCMLVCTHA